VSAQALTSGVERYRLLRIWKNNSRIKPEAIVKFQTMLQNLALEAAKRFKYEKLGGEGFRP
jgi:hypothetical protein